MSREMKVEENSLNGARGILALLVWYNFHRQL